jgi:hypothetical protein
VTRAIQAIKAHKVFKVLLAQLERQVKLAQQGHKAQAV